MDYVELFTNEEVAKMLRLSPVSLWRRRRERKIGYSRDNGKILYSREDIELYCARNHQQPAEAREVSKKQ
ncbi:MAG: helix-turn-helix domain-containing protein [Blastocatellia bacterium]|nr:helix-turn-helix domain-containing protein [Blastocatellia bacterium]